MLRNEKFLSRRRWRQSKAQCVSTGVERKNEERAIEDERQPFDYYGLSPAHAGLGNLDGNLPQR